MRPTSQPVIGLQVSPAEQSAGVAVCRHVPVTGSQTSVVQSIVSAQSGSTVQPGGPWSMGVGPESMRMGPRSSSVPKSLREASSSAPLSSLPKSDRDPPSLAGSASWPAQLARSPANHPTASIVATRFVMRCPRLSTRQHRWRWDPARRAFLYFHERQPVYGDRRVPTLRLEADVAAGLPPLIASDRYMLIVVPPSVGVLDGHIATLELKQVPVPRSQHTGSEGVGFDGQLAWQSASVPQLGVQRRPASARPRSTGPPPRSTIPPPRSSPGTYISTACPRSRGPPSMPVGVRGPSRPPAQPASRAMSASTAKEKLTCCMAVPPDCRRP